MSFKSESFSTMSLIFSNDLTKVLLKENRGKLDGILFPNNHQIDAIQLSKLAARDTNLQIEPGKWRLVTSLQNIEKIWRIDVYMTMTDISTSISTAISVKELPDNCHPNIKWLVPLCLDASVYGTVYNQILMK